MPDDILSVIFLALICIVIAGIVTHIAPSGLQMPCIALVAVCLWIAYDYILVKRNKAKAACHVSKEEKNVDEDVDEQIASLTKELNSTVDEQPGAVQTVSQKPEQQHKNEFDILMYDPDASIKELYTDMGCAGDTRIANRMKYAAMQSKVATDIRTRMNANKLRPYFEEELAEQEKRDWWDEESDYLDEYM